MKTAPNLLNFNAAPPISPEVFSDLQLDQLLNKDTVSVLQRPCGEREIVRRLELFLLLENDEIVGRLRNALSVLSDEERSLRLFQEADISLDRYHRFARVLQSHAASYEHLISLSDLGSLWKDVSCYFSSEEKQNLLCEMKESAQRIKTLSEKMRVFLLSLSDKNWLTPDCKAVSEYDLIGECAEQLGFSLPAKKKLNGKINRALSDAVCRLCAEEAAEIEAYISKYADADFREVLSYIREIKFFLEIRTLIQKADEIGVSHCFPTIAKKPRYTAMDLYDVSLLLKKSEAIVPNDADFTEDESFCFLIGANGGGKTTYLRAVGINLIFFLSGCPIFAKSAEIFPFDFVCSHFPKDERFENVGRLDEEKKRAEDMLEAAAGKNAFLLFNETYSGTDEKRGFSYLKNTAEQIREGGYYGLYVTHFHEVLTLDCPILSAEVNSSCENERTFRIAKAKGRASSYASDILKKYRLDKKSLAARREKA